MGMLRWRHADSSTQVREWKVTKEVIIKGPWQFTKGGITSRERESSEMFYQSSEDQVRLPRDQTGNEVRRGSQKAAIGCLRQKRRQTS